MDHSDQNGASINMWHLEEKDKLCTDEDSYNCSFVYVGISLYIILKSVFFFWLLLFLLYEKVTVALQMIVFFLTCTERIWNSSKVIKPKQ